MPSDKTTFTRPDWDEYFLLITDSVSLRGSCDRGRCGSVITKDNRIIMTGYVGSPPGLPHCDEAGHKMEERHHEDGTVTQHCVRTIHAEENAILHAARFGVSLKGTTLYTKMTPCINCARRIVACGITRVVSSNGYHAGNASVDLFEQNGITFKIINNELTY